MSIPEAAILALAIRLQKNPEEIDEQWSARWVNLLLFYFDAQHEASELKV